jgi:hypothetical protein
LYRLGSVGSGLEAQPSTSLIRDLDGMLPISSFGQKGPQSPFSCFSTSKCGISTHGDANPVVSTSVHTTHRCYKHFSFVEWRADRMWCLKIEHLFWQAQTLLPSNLDRKQYFSITMPLFLTPGTYQLFSPEHNLKTAGEDK